MKPLTPLALTFALLAGGALAQSGPSRDPTAVQAGTYAVESRHTRVLFSVVHLGFTTWYGDFTGVSGSFTLDPKSPDAARVSVSVPTSSISTTNTTLDGELKSPDWFDAAKFPTIDFKSTGVTVTGPGQADVAGDLTLHGVTRPIILKARFNAAGVNMMSRAYTVGFEGSGVIKRSEFGVTKYPGAIGDDVTLIISAAFEKKPG